MRRFGVAAIAAVLILLCQACEPGGARQPAEASPPESPPVFAAEVGYELHMDEPGYRKVDVVFPRVADSVTGGADINARLAEDFVFTEDGSWVAEGYPYTWSQIWYSISEQGGIYSLDIISRTSSLKHPEYISIENVISYYYDGNTREVIPTREAYLARLGYNDGDILAFLKEQYEDRYDGLAFQLYPPVLWYYFGADGEIVFFTQMLDYMAAQRDALLEHEFVKDGAPNRAAIAAAYAVRPQTAARRMAQLYADIIRYGADIDVMDWGDGYWAEEEANKLSAFERLFDRGTLTVTEPRKKENYVDTYECELVGSGPMGVRRMPLLISFSPDAAQPFYCPLPTYAEKCFSVTQEYLRLLHEGDAGVLSAWLSIDGGPDYFREEAEALIAYYARYDLSQTDLLGLDYFIGEDAFTIGVRDATGAIFYIRLVYDGIFVLPDFHFVLDGALPVPTAAMFGLTGLEAEIFSAVMDYERQFMVEGLYDLMLPRIGIFDSYAVSESEIAVVCQIETRCYYRSDTKIFGEGWEWKPGCVVLKKLGETEYEWVSYKPAESGQSDLPGHGYGGSIRAFCGPLTELADRLMGGWPALFETDPGYFLPGGDALVELYRTALGWNG